MWTLLELRRFTCPSCGESVRFHGNPSSSIRFPCSRCSAELILGFKYHWVFVALCVGIAVLLASLQGFEEPLFVLRCLIGASVILILGTRVLLPFFPMKVRLDRTRIQTIRIPR
jgi:hypothetical protein